MPLTDELLERLFRANKSLQAAGMGELSNDEIRAQVSKTYQRPDVGGLAPLSSGVNLPIAGFQGNSVFPNQSGSGLLQAGQVPPPQEPSGMDFNVRLGPDGNPQQILLRRLSNARRSV